MAEFVLKDWYNRERTFNKDVIYVQNKDGDLIQFTEGTGEASVVPLKVTENGTYTPPDGVDGYSPVIVDVKGSGGGGLPAGGYWEEDEVGMPNKYPQFLFMYNGTLHCLTAVAYNLTTKGYYIFRRDGNTWTQVLYGTNISAPISYRTTVEYNGKVHFLGYASVHYVWDGVGEITALNKLPESIGNYTYRAFVQDGKLKYLDDYNTNVYVWDEANDTWTLEASRITGSKNCYGVMCNGATGVYFVCTTTQKLYKYENGSLTELHNVPSSLGTTNNNVVDGKYLYATAPHPEKNYTAVAKLNLETGEIAYFGRYPDLGYQTEVRLCAPDRPRYYGIDHNGSIMFSRVNLILHEVTE